jgi:predicted RNA-binding protein with RPS1 domain
VVLKVDPNEEKISLGMKQTEQDPWVVLPLKYPVGTRINGKVRNLTSFGAFVEIEPGIDGLIHISDMSWTKRVQHPSEVVKKGDAVDVVILNIDSENKRISLGLKQAEEDPWLRIGETYPVGTEMRSKVVRLMDKGVVVDIGNDIEGFVPISQLGQGAAVNSPADVVYEGMNLDTRVLEVDPIHRRIVLSVVNIRRSSRPVRRRRPRSTRTTATRSKFQSTSPSTSSHRTVQRTREPAPACRSGLSRFATLRSHALRGKGGDPPACRASPRKRARYGAVRLPRGAHLRGRTARDDQAPLVAGARTDIDDPVARGDHAHVVLHHDHGVACVHESVELRLQALDVRWVQAGRGLVQHVQRVAALHAL